MSKKLAKDQSCIIIGASHAGVNCAFQLRREGWEGKIQLFDASEDFPYHRPPLSKSCLLEDELQLNFLKPKDSYEKNEIDLKLGKRVISIDKEKKSLSCDQGEEFFYDKLVLATGARAAIPPIPGLSEVKNLFVLRSAADVVQIRKGIQHIASPKILIIGGGFIGLEVAASLRKLGLEVELLEREERILARVSCPEISTFFQQYHESKGAKIFCGKELTHIEVQENRNLISCADGSSFEADLLVLGTGIMVNIELAKQAEIEVENGIKVNEYMETSVADIYAIGDNSYHFHPLYQRFTRIESVPNAVAQARIAASRISGKSMVYTEVPWFWSDQYGLKFQTAGLFNGYEELIMRKEGEDKFSVWYFKGDQLVAVDAVNSPKAYMMGRRLIKEGNRIDKTKLVDTNL
ncbi:MAG: FAD-dependent oxidoreductase, partial [Bacteroidota bacterium]